MLLLCNSVQRVRVHKSVTLQITGKGRFMLDVKAKLQTVLKSLNIINWALVYISHAGTVVPECFKDDNASQWKSGKFDPRSLKNPQTDRHLNLHG